MRCPQPAIGVSSRPTIPSSTRRRPHLISAYVRLPGPAGHRSRYDDDAITQVAEHCRSLTAETVVCVFRNIDAFANAQQLVTLLA